MLPNSAIYYLSVTFTTEILQLIMFFCFTQFKDVLMGCATALSVAIGSMDRISNN